MHLSSIQKDISIKLNSIKDKQKKILKKERNNIMAQIHNIVKNEKNDNIRYALENFERNENNTTKMYEPVKKLNDWYAKKWLSKQKDSNEKKQSEIIAEYFQNIFYINATSMQNALATPMSALFTSSEIRKAVWTIKNNKSPGMDQINTELIKYSPEVMYEKIADIFKNIAATWKHPNEITHGILRVLQNQYKSQSLTNNSFIRS